MVRDVVQSTVCHAIAGLDRYRFEAPLFTWLCACCRNEIAAHYRRLGRRPREVGFDDGVVATDVAAAADDEPGPQARALLAEEAELVHAALDALPQGWGQALEWRYLDGLTVPEIADRLATTYKAAESLLARARGAFRERFAHLVREGPGAAAGQGEEVLRR